MKRLISFTFTLLLFLGACKTRSGDSPEKNAETNQDKGSQTLLGDLVPGTSGEDFNIVKSKNDYILNLPNASQNSRGALSSHDWELFNSKLSSVSDDASPSLGNDLDTAGNAIISSAGHNVFINPDNGQDLVVSSAIQRGGFFQAYANTNSNLTASDVVSFGAQSRLDSNYYSHSIASDTDKITILKSGFYKISYSVNFYSNYANRLLIRSYLDADGTELIPSKSYCYVRHKSYVRRCTNAVTLIANLTEGQILRLKVSSSTNDTFSNAKSVDVLANESWILIEKI